MEELNKNQLILLALLVSFVTSIATGIVTVSLMDQAPQSVTQTINKVVTQTIEKVTKEPAAVIQAIPEEDLIAVAVEKNALGGVKVRLGANGDIVGYGMVVAASGLIASDVNPDNYAAEAKYYAVFSDGKEFPMDVALRDKSGISFFRVALGEGATAYAPASVALGDSDKLKLGQTVLVIAPSGDSLQKGIISGIVRDSTSDAATSTATSTEGAEAVKSVKLIKLSITLSAENSGSPLVDLSGKTMGLTVYRDGLKMAVPSNVIREGIASLAKKASP